MHDYKSLHVMVMICATLVNTHTHTHTHSFWLHDINLISQLKQSLHIVATLKEMWPRVWPGHPPPFTFTFLLLAVPIFFFCPSLPFLPELQSPQSHSVSRPEVVGSDRIWVQFVLFVLSVFLSLDIFWCFVVFGLVQFCVCVSSVL